MKRIRSGFINKLITTSENPNVVTYIKISTLFGWKTSNDVTNAAFETCQQAVIVQCSCGGVVNVNNVNAVCSWSAASLHNCCNTTSAWPPKGGP